MSFNIINYGELIRVIYLLLSFVGFSNGLFLSILVYFKNSSKKVLNGYLFLLILIISLVLLQHLALVYFGDIPKPSYIPVFYFIYFILLGNLGPALFNYIWLVQKRNPKFRLRQLWHFLPISLCIITLSLFYVPGLIFKLLHIIPIYLFLIYSIFSIILVCISYYKYPNNEVELTKNDLLGLFSIVFLIFIVALLNFNLIYQFVPMHIHVIQSIMLTFLLCCFLFQEVFFHKTEHLHNLHSKYSGSKLTFELSQDYLTLIQTYIIEHNTYLNSRLTLPMLSKELKISHNIISQVINEQTNKNFSDYINSFRIEEAKRILIIPKNNQILISEIAYNCGFNSLSAFNIAFKKHTGITPSQFKLRNK